MTESLIPFKAPERDFGSDNRSGMIPDALAAGQSRLSDVKAVIMATLTPGASGT